MDDPVTVVVSWVFGVIIVVMVVLGFYFQDQSFHEWEDKCEPYASTPQKDIPGECVSYWDGR